jgi:NADH-quinone oxidoreductase subunit E
LLEYVLVKHIKSNIGILISKIISAILEILPCVLHYCGDTMAMTAPWNIFASSDAYHSSFTKEVLMNDRLQAIQTIVEARRQQRGALLSILEDVQRTSDHNYLRAEELVHVAKLLGLPLSQVYSVATFYAFFNITPQGEHVITVCRGTACHTRGSKPLLEKVLTHLGVELGEDGSVTTADYRFTVQTVACFGQCALAPVIAIDEVIHSKVTEVQMVELVKALQERGVDDAERT